MWSNTYLVFSWQDVFQAGGVLGKRGLKQQMTSVIGPPPFLRTYTPLKTTYCPCINKTENGDPWHMCVAKTNQPSPTAGSSPQILYYWIQPPEIVWPFCVTLGRQSFLDQAALQSIIHLRLKLTAPILPKVWKNLWQNQISYRDIFYSSSVCHIAVVIFSTVCWAFPKRGFKTPMGIENGGSHMFPGSRLLLKSVIGTLIVVVVRPKDIWRIHDTQKSVTRSTSYIHHLMPSVKFRHGSWWDSDISILSTQ